MKVVSTLRCFFIGHHDASESIYPQLVEAVRRHIEKYSVNEFVVGQYGSFDRMAARAVLAVKEDQPEVKLLILLPYHPSERAIHAPEGYDGTIYPPGMETVPRRLAIVRANRYMIDHSTYLICYVRHPGNARELMDYGNKKKREILQL